MKLIIDIDEDIYNLCKDLSTNYINIPIGYLNVVVGNGTPLPKEHGYLIDSDVLCEQYEKTYGDLYQALDLTPIIIEADEGE